MKKTLLFLLFSVALFAAPNTVINNVVVQNAGTALSANQVPYVGAGSLLTGDADMTFSGSRLTVTDLTVTNFPTFSAGTATRVPFFSTAGLLADSAALLFNSGTGQLTATSFALGTTTPGVISGASGAIVATPTAGNVFKSDTGWSSASNTTTYAATTDIDITKNLQTVSLTGNVTFTTSNKSAGIYTTVRVVADGTNRTLTFPSWVFVGTVAPTTLVANKTAILTLICFGTADTDIVASWVSQP